MNILVSTMSIVFQWHKNVGKKSETNQKFQMDKSY